MSGGGLLSAYFVTEDSSSNGFFSIKTETNEVTKGMFKLMANLPFVKFLSVETLVYSFAQQSCSCAFSSTHESSGFTKAQERSSSPNVTFSTILSSPQ